MLSIIKDTLRIFYENKILITLIFIIIVIIARWFAFSKEIKQRQEEVSNIKLKDLILKSNKDDVVNFVFNYMEKVDKRDFNEMITYSKDYICPIFDIEYLHYGYDRMYSLAEMEYSNAETINYSASIGIADNGVPCCFFGLGIFIDIVLTEANLDCTECFINDKDNKNVLPIVFMLNCRIKKYDLNTENAKLVGFCLLQMLFIEEYNKYII